MNSSKKDSQRTDEGFLSTLIDEIPHIWQGVQVGPLYMLQSVCSQFQAVLAGLSDPLVFTRNTQA